MLFTISQFMGLTLWIFQLLNEVHSRFFDAYDVRSPENTRRKVVPTSRSYDVTVRPILDLLFAGS